MVDSSMNTSARFLALPSEIIHIILNYTDKRGLKGLRGTNKHLHKIATSQLFRSFNVYPHIRSLEYLVNVATSPQIGPCIRSLKFDAGYFGVTTMILRQLRSVYTATLTDDERKSIMHHALDLDRQALFIHDDKNMDETVLTSYLQDAFAHLTNLQSIEAWDGDPQPWQVNLMEIPGFYDQLIQETCGRSPHTRLMRDSYMPGFSSMTYIRALLMALRKLPGRLDSLALNRFSWRHFRFSAHMLMHTSLTGLRSLELAPSNNAIVIEMRGLHNPVTLLRRASDLEELSITFWSGLDLKYAGPDMRNPNTGAMCMSKFQQVGPGLDAEEVERVGPVRLTWSNKLRKLRLAGLVCREGELRTILKRAASTLRILELHDLLLMPDTLPGPRACLVQLINWMEKHLPLEEIALSGFLSNGGMQRWDISAERKAQDEGLLGCVRRFILYGDKHPLDHVAIAPGHFDVHQKTYSASVPESLRKDKYAGDWTFGMKYSDDIESGTFRTYEEWEAEFWEDLEETSDDEDDDEEMDEEEEDEDDGDEEGLWALAHPSVPVQNPFDGLADDELADIDTFCQALLD